MQRGTVGAPPNLSLGTDGRFGPLDLANEPSGVGDKDIG